jgi:hypothetical protein
MYFSNTMGNTVPLIQGVPSAVGLGMLLCQPTRCMPVDIGGGLPRNGRGGHYSRSCLHISRRSTSIEWAPQVDQAGKQGCVRISQLQWGLNGYAFHCTYQPQTVVWSTHKRCAFSRELLKPLLNPGDSWQQSSGIEAGVIGLVCAQRKKCI